MRMPGDGTGALAKRRKRPRHLVVSMHDPQNGMILRFRTGLVFLLTYLICLLGQLSECFPVVAARVMIRILPLVYLPAFWEWFETRYR